ncbi:FxsA family protein [Neisseria weaveri]|uniref:FxsA family protein n=1 Tax=Neisseria weaveri TaxID=28091 RepID=UPI000D318831|nr:FxsA family protein [Neisseria weaveri]
MQFFGIGFLVLLFLEIMSIVWVADWLGGGVTFGLMVLSFISGIFMLRNTGVSGVLMAGAAMRNGGQVSLYQLLWPIRYTVAALMLMSPGFVSLILAVVLLLPFKGKPVADMSNTFTYGQNPFEPHNPNRQPHANHHDEDIIEGEYTVDPDNNQAKQRSYIEHKHD